MFNVNDVLTDTIVNYSSGALRPSSSINTSKEFIELTVGEVYTASLGMRHMYLYFYRADESYAGSATFVTINTNTITEYTFTAEFPKVKISFLNTATNIMLEKGNVKTAYEPYYGEILNETVNILEIVESRDTFNNLNERLNYFRELIGKASLDFSVFNLAYIKDRKVTCNYTEGSTTTAKYTGVDLGEGVLPVSMKFKVIFSEGTGSSSAMAISNPNGLTKVANITKSSCHFGMTLNQAFIEWFTDTVNDGKYKYNFTTPCKADGVTEYTFGWSVSGNTVTFTMPDGATQVYTDAQMATHLGRYCTFEHFANGITDGENRTLPQFTYFEIVTNTGKTIIDKFRRFDGAIGNAPTGESYVQITNGGY